MRHFSNYTRDVVPEDVVRAAIRADGGGREWALDWIGGDGPGWWRIMWNWEDEKWPRPARARALLRTLEELGLVGFPDSETECVIAVHRCDRIAIPKWIGRVEMDSPIKTIGPAEK